MHNACMTVNVTIRNVPDEVRDALAARASAMGQSMQEYLLRELISVASRLTPGEAVDKARDFSRTLPKISTTDILEALEADRR